MDIEEFRAKHRKIFVPVVRKQTGEFLAELVKTEKPSRILEFGTAVGLSTIIMLKANTAATLDTIELDETRANEARKNIAAEGLGDRANVITGDALEQAKKLAEGNKKYDLIFLDSSKGQYPKLLPYIIRLLAGGGTLVADDVLFFGYVMGEPPKKHRSSTYRLREFIEAATTAEELENVQILDMENGVLVAKRKKTNEN